MSKNDPNNGEVEPHNRDRIKEGQIMVWIYNLLEEVGTGEYDHFLRDGTVLCRLMNVIKPGSIPGEITPGDNLKHKKKNIQNFLKACADYGLGKEKLFDPDDLLFMRNIPKVTRCILALGKQAESDPKFEGPIIGDEPFDQVMNLGRRKSGLPQGDDLLVSNVDVKTVLQRLPSVDSSQKP